MMMNLFSMFDPSMFYFKSFPWIIILCTLLIYFPKYFFISKFNTTKNIFLSFMVKELNILLKENKHKGMVMILTSVFMTMVSINLASLFPFIFTSTAHISLALPMSFVMWMSLIMFGFINNTKNMMAHMVPFGTPILLMNFMVMVELISNTIRPITLSVRLTANMIAGHLLLSLLGSFSLMGGMNFNISILFMLLLSLLELSVSFIQSYVFMTLMCLYSTEIHYA